MTDDALKAVRNAQAHRFEINLGGETAFTEYQEEPGALLLPHTVTPDAFRGRGVGGVLARAVLDYARAQGLKVKPTCSFLAAWITKHPEYHDMVDEGFRARLGIG